MRDDRTLNAVDTTLNLGTVLVGRRLHCHSTVDSTNELAKALAMTVIDLVADAKMITRVREEFQQQDD